MARIPASARALTIALASSAGVLGFAHSPAQAAEEYYVFKRSTASESNGNALHAGTPANGFAQPSSSLVTRPPVASRLADKTPTPAINCPEESLQGCFTSSGQMGQYLDMVKPLLTDFFVTSYGADFPKPEIRYVKALETGRSGCTDENGGPAGFDQDSYFYCGPDSTIYVGEEMMWQLYTRAGPIAPALGLAHEWGHHLQKERHVQISSQIPFEAQVKFENQADCVAGAWLRYENGKGLFKGEVDDATVSAMSTIIADAEGRSHGMDLERLLGFSKGTAWGLADARTGNGCDQFSPDTPISPP